MEPHRRVLIVEDDPEYVRFLTAVLDREKNGYSVQTAATLSSAFAAASDFAAEVILLDLNLPDSSGYDTFLKLRERIPDTPVILLTGVDDDETAVRAADDGAQHYLVKGLQQPKVIERTVRMTLRQQSRQQRSRRDSTDLRGHPELYFG